MTDDGMHKVFGIGLNKTGTTTLQHCGTALGYHCSGSSRQFLKEVKIRNNLSNLEKHVDYYDLFQDWPWPLLYREVDRIAPGSKFILTVRRNEQAWLESLKKHSMRTRPIRHSRKIVYGHRYPHYYPDEYLAVYRRHNDEVRSYFADRQNDFVELCWEHGDGWDKLCGFLGKEIPDAPFPHANNSDAAKSYRTRRILNHVLCHYLTRHPK